MVIILLSKPLNFLKKIQEHPLLPVTWQSYNNEKVRFLGGKVIKAFNLSEMNRYFPGLDKDAGKMIVVADLRSQGIDNYGIL